MIPNIPPHISFSFVPIIPDFVYISTAKSTLITINAITATSTFEAVFLLPAGLIHQKSHCRMVNL